MRGGVVDFNEELGALPSGEPLGVLGELLRYGHHLLAGTLHRLGVRVDLVEAVPGEVDEFDCHPRCEAGQAQDQAADHELGGRLGHLTGSPAANSCLAHAVIEHS